MSGRVGVGRLGAGRTMLEVEGSRVVAVDAVAAVVAAEEGSLAEGEVEVGAEAVARGRVYRMAGCWRMAEVVSVVAGTDV